MLIMPRRNYVRGCVWVYVGICGYMLVYMGGCGYMWVYVGIC